MRLAISNIAWDTAEDSAVARLLQRYNIDAIDIAPSKYFPEPREAATADILAVRDWWSARGIEITGMQALLFGTTGLNLFGPPKVQQAMLDHLGAICRIASGLGAPRLVFGSPRNRDRGRLDDDNTMNIAVPFFEKLAAIAADHDVTICLEPNPVSYGANFMTTSAETIDVVLQVAHPNIRMQFDTGSLTINGEDPAVVLECNAELIGHIHASEPDLVPLGDGSTDHGKMSAALRQSLPQNVVTIEMLATNDEPHLDSVERALGTAIRLYRNNNGRHST